PAVATLLKNAARSPLVAIGSATSAYLRLGKPVTRLTVTSSRSSMSSRISALVVTRAFFASVMSIAQLGAHVMPFARYWITTRPVPEALVRFRRRPTVRFLRSNVVLSGAFTLETCRIELRFRATVPLSVWSTTSDEASVGGGYWG